MLVAAVVIIGFEMYLAFVFQQNPQAFPLVGRESQSSPSSASLQGGGGTTNETTVPEFRETTFVQRATPENVVDNSTYLDSPLITGRPDAFIQVTRSPERVSDPAGNKHPIGVWYDRNRDGKWAVYNQDLAPMREDEIFYIAVLEGPNKFVHRVKPSNTVENSTYIDQPLANGNPDAIVEVTANWNPGGGPGVYNNSFIGVRYDPERKRWTIFNRDLAPMPNGASFNVAVSQKS